MHTYWAVRYKDGNKFIVIAIFLVKVHADFFARHMTAQVGGFFEVVAKDSENDTLA
jgi:hypothetical protein